MRSFYLIIIIIFLARDSYGKNSCFSILMTQYNDIGAYSLQDQAKKIASLSDSSGQTLGEMIKRFVTENAFWTVRQQTHGISDNDVIKAINGSENRTYFKTILYQVWKSPWALSWIPDLNFRIFGFSRMLEEYYSDKSSSLSEKFEKMKNVLRSTSPPLDSEDVKNITEVTKRGFEPDHADQKNQSEVSSLDNFLNRTLSVLPFSKWRTLEAQKAISRIKEIMNVNGHESLIKETVEILTDNRYQEPLRKLTLRLFDIANDNKEVRGNLYEDLVNVFLAESYDMSTALDMTWNTIAILAKAGPNLVMRMRYFNEEQKKTTSGKNRNEVVKLSLSMLAALIPVLDSKTSNEGNMYSYPSNVISHADTGKNYHFWMSAYLARRLVKEGYSHEAASAAVYTVAMGYQFISRSAGRSPEHSLYYKKFYGYPNIIRFDLNYAAAGARYGSLSEPNTESLNIDLGIKNSLQNVKGESLKWMTAKDVFKYNLPVAFHIWTMRYRPYSIFRFYNE